MKKRILAWLLILCLLAVPLSGCGDSAEDTQPEQTTPAEPLEDGAEIQSALLPDTVYQASYTDLDADGQLESTSMCCISGDYVFFTGQIVTGTAFAVNEATGETILNLQTGEPIEIDTVETALFRMDLTTKETVQLDYAPSEPTDGMLGSAVIAAMAAGSDGSFWILENLNTYTYDLPENFDAQKDSIANYYVSGENLVFLRQYSADGQRLKMLDLSTLRGLENPEMCFDADGNIYLGTSQVVYVVDAEGAVLAQLPNSDGASLVQTGPSEIGLLQQLSAFKRIDPALQNYGTVTQFPSKVSGLYSGVGNYQYFYEDLSGTVYGCRADTGETETMFSWSECNVDRSNLSDIQLRNDGRVAAIRTQLISATWKYQLVMMEPVDGDALPQTTELTLACTSSISISRAVTAFNQTHSDVQIVIQDYSQYGTEEHRNAGLTRLNTELLSGDLPDLLFTFQLPVDQYAAAGILVDLWPLIDSDEELSRDDLMTHLFDVMSTDGKLYQVTDSFNISTAVGSADVIGDRTSWTVDDALNLMAAMPDASEALGLYSSKIRVLTFLLDKNLEHFINWENQTCSFDSPEFIEILNFSNSFPDSSTGDSTETDYARFQSGRQLLLNAYISALTDMQFLSAQVGGNPCFVGYPSATGSGSSFEVNHGVAITTACQDVDAAWSFLRMLLSEDYQTETSTVSSGFPSNRHAFEAEMKRDMDADTFNLQYYTDAGGTEFQSHVVTQAEYEQFMRLYESCGGLSVTNYGTLEIILAEVAPFFDGQKTAEEVAALIQNRVGLYVMEQS